MANPPFLSLNNPRKVLSALSGIVDQTAIDRIESEICNQTQLMFNLSLKHFRIAERLKGPDWRQKISRSYYASYNCSKMVRYYVEGALARDNTDHKKVGDLPDNFPNRSIYRNKLAVMREDRNLCDYDHNAKASDLSIGTKESIDLSRSFIRSAKIYLVSRGLQLSGKI